MDKIAVADSAAAKGKLCDLFREKFRAEVGCRLLFS